METEAPPGEELAQYLGQCLGSNSCTSACKGFALQMGEMRPREGSDLPKVIQRVGGRAKSAWGTSQLHRPLQAHEGISGTPPPGGGRSVRQDTTPRCRSPGLCRSATGGAAPTPPRHRAAWEGRPGRPGASGPGPPAGTCCSPCIVRSPSETEGLAGRPSLHGVCSRRPPRRLPHSQTPPPQRATPPAAITRHASAITRFPALGCGHTPPTALIGSLPHPPGASGYSIGPSGMSVK